MLTPTDEAVEMPPRQSFSPHSVGRRYFSFRQACWRGNPGRSPVGIHKAEPAAPHPAHGRAESFAHFHAEDYG